MAGHVGEVGIGHRELDHEGLLVGAGDAGELVGLAGHEGVVAVHHGDVVVDGRGGRLVGLGVDQAGPGTLEGLGVHRVAVVELGALHKGEGELGGVVVGLPGGGGAGDELALLVVVVGQAVEDLVADLRALGLLAVVGVDGDGVVDVHLGGGTGALGLGSGGVVGLLASRERQKRGRRGGPLEERAAADLHLLTHMLSPSVSWPRPRHGQQSPEVTDLHGASAWDKSISQSFLICKENGGLPSLILWIVTFPKSKAVRAGVKKVPYFPM